MLPLSLGHPLGVGGDVVADHLQVPLKREPTKKPHRRRAISKTLALQIVVVVLAPLGVKSWLAERAAYGSLVSLAAGHGGHHALGDMKAPLAQRVRTDVAVGGGGSCVSEEATADAFGMASRASGDPKVCTPRVRRVV